MAPPRATLWTAPNWPVDTWASSGRTSRPGGRARRSSPISTTPARKFSSSAFAQGGVLDAATAGRVPSFRAFLYGVIRNVARRFESRPTCAAALPSDFAANEESQSRLFERTWARSVMVEAARLQRQRAHERGDEAVRRVELLRLRFEDNLPIRTIADRWGVPAAGLHHAYALARQEFKAALLEVVAFHQPGSAAEVEQEAAGLLKVLS